ncbi:MAG TPA: SAM-dependent methyltransferase [Streptosporangiaceae bacterium]
MTAGETGPNMARMYDYWLGGTDNYEADRAAAEAVRRQRPRVAEQALDNKRFLTRAVRFVAGRGVHQFLDIGAGLPTSPLPAPGADPLWQATHEAARAVSPGAVVAYADIDPVAVAQAQGLLAGGSGVVAVTGDMRDPLAILGDERIRAAGFSPAAPAGVILGCMLHFLDAPTAHGVLATLVGALAPDSYVIISVGYSPGADGQHFARSYNAQDGPRIYAHALPDITALFNGLELVPPGLVNAAAWQAPEPPPHDEDPSMILAGVGRKP